MLSEHAKQLMEKQGYRIVGDHSAVKTCGWTTKMIKGEGGCYKLKFYGIMSHQCLQMTTSISCANRCTFCWRGYKAPVSKDWKWGVDAPQEIFDGSLKAQKSLLVGYKGHKHVNKKLWEGSNTVKHVALSLTGEPIAYPKINELINIFNKEGISTFLVTNAQFPEQIRDLNPVTQLYVSVDAPNKELLKEVDVPLFTDYWERLNQGLEYLSQKKERTCIRLTLIKEQNMTDMSGYAQLISKGNPDFLEIKGYMFVGSSRQRLSMKNMPWHEEIVSFSKELMNHLPDYEIVSEHIPSRVVMCAKKEYKINNKWHTWINFNKWHEIITSGKELNVKDYLLTTPSVGLSGKITRNLEKYPLKDTEPNVYFVNEKDDELSMWQ